MKHTLDGAKMKKLLKISIGIISLLLALFLITTLFSRDNRPEKTALLNISLKTDKKPYDLDKKLQFNPPLTDIEKEKIDGDFKKAQIVAIGKMVNLSPNKDRLPYTAIALEEIFKLSSDVLKDKGELTGKYIRVNKMPETGFNYYRISNNTGNYLLIYGYIDAMDSKDKLTGNHFRITSFRENILAKQKDIELAAADIVFLGKKHNMPKGWAIPNHYQYRLAAFDLLHVLSGQAIEDYIVVRYVMLPEHGEFNSITLNIFDVSKYYWILAHKIAGTNHYRAKTIGADLTTEIKYLREIGIE